VSHNLNFLYLLPTLNLTGAFFLLELCQALLGLLSINNNQYHERTQALWLVSSRQKDAVATAAAKVVQPLIWYQKQNTWVLKHLERDYGPDAAIRARAPSSKFWRPPRLRGPDVAFEGDAPVEPFPGMRLQRSSHLQAARGDSCHDGEAGGVGRNAESSDWSAGLTADE